MFSALVHWGTGGDASYKEYSTLGFYNIAATLGSISGEVPGVHPENSNRIIEGK